METNEKIGLNIVIEKEKSRDKTIFTATSPDINVFAEGKSVEEAINKFREGARFHLESFPEEKTGLLETEEEKFEMPMIAKVFL